MNKQTTFEIFTPISKAVKSPWGRMENGEAIFDGVAFGLPDENTFGFKHVTWGMHATGGGLGVNKGQRVVWQVVTDGDTSYVPSCGYLVESAQ